MMVSEVCMTITGIPQIILGLPMFTEGLSMITRWTQWWSNLNDSFASHCCGFDSPFYCKLVCAPSSAVLVLHHSECSSASFFIRIPGKKSQILMWAEMMNWTVVAQSFWDSHSFSCVIAPWGQKWFLTCLCRGQECRMCCRVCVAVPHFIKCFWDSHSFSCVIARWGQKWFLTCLCRGQECRMFCRVCVAVPHRQSGVCHRPRCKGGSAGGSVQRIVTIAITERLPSIPSLKLLALSFTFLVK